MKIEFNKNYGKWFSNNVLKAINRYNMIEENEEVCVALSGGKDSVTLLYILKYLQHYSKLKFRLSAIHVKVFSNYDSSLLKEFCNQLEVRYLETSIISKEEIPEKSICYLCSRLKRGAISEELKQNAITKVCYGHHANDVAETLLMNITENRKLGSFSPRVEVPGSPLIIVRPMVYVEEGIIRALHKKHQLPLLEEVCPYGDCNQRKDYKEVIEKISEITGKKNLSEIIVQSLENIDTTNIWKQR